MPKKFQGECWLWCRAMSQGYGTIGFKVKGRWTTLRAHRVVYEALVGPIPKGLQLDHLCRVRHCVNPDHLEPVTQRENIMRGEGIAASNARKTYCHEGHLLTSGNVYRRPDRNGRTRECTECRREAGKKFRNNRKVLIAI